MGPDVTESGETGLAGAGPDVSGDAKRCGWAPLGYPDGRQLRIVATRPRGAVTPTTRHISVTFDTVDAEMRL